MMLKFVMNFCILQILTLCNCKVDVKKRAHAVIDKFAERGLRSLAVARQVIIMLNGSKFISIWETLSNHCYV